MTETYNGSGGGQNLSPEEIKALQEAVQQQLNIHRDVAYKAGETEPGQKVVDRKGPEKAFNGFLEQSIKRN